MIDTHAIETINPDHAAELYDADNGTAAGPWTRVGRQYIRTRRWSEQYYLVLANEQGQHWGLVFDEGLTEMQETSLPWEDGDDPLPLVRLYPHEVVTTAYRTKPAEGSPC